MVRLTQFLAALLTLLPAIALGGSVDFDVRSSGSGNWSSPETWEGKKVPQAGSRVQVKAGHRVVYDVQSDDPIRVVHVAGTLVFSREKSTRLSVGLLKVQAGELCNEDGFVCAVHDDASAAAERKSSALPAASLEAAAGVPVDEKPALEIGTAADPLPANITATIRLVYFEGQDQETLPAIITCGGRMDFHGTPLNRTWLKLAQPAKAGETTVVLSEAVSGWKPGDKVIVTTAKPLEYQDGKGGKKGKNVSGTEERTIVSVEGVRVTLDQQLQFDHAASEARRCEVANLSRNVVVESADPAGVRGHTMYHRHSAGSISYAEFRHLGKKGVLGKYPIHFHLVRDGMRGFGGVVGASIWDSANRFIAIHGTDYLLVRDIVGYQCVGHGFFLEDGTEQYNLLDRNLAVQAKQGKPLKDQILTFDQNEGAGFWWANGRNTLTRNVACENHKYGFRYEIGKVHGRPPILPIRQPDGSVESVDVRGIPVYRFDSNESHSEGLYSFFFGDDPAGSVHGDPQHPFILRNLFCWETHYCLRTSMTNVLVEHFEVYDGVYGVYHPDYNNHVYRDVKLHRVTAEPINRGHDDESIQFGSFTYDSLLLDKCTGMPLIQLSCTAPVEGLTGHFRNLKVIPSSYPGPRQQRVVDLGVGPILPKKELQKSVAYYFHDSTSDAGKTLRVVSEHFTDAMKDGGDYKVIPGFTGKQVRAAEVPQVEFPKLLDPVDDLPPATLITSVRRLGDKLLVRGVTHDNGDIASVLVNGQPATILSQSTGVADWEATIKPASAVVAHATDQSGNIEKVPARYEAKLTK